MSTLLQDYESKVVEIDAYFRFLEDVLERNADLQFPRGRKRKLQPITEDLQKILKANAYLLLYNLMESTVRSGITAIYEAVRFDGLGYSDVCEQLQKVWALEKFPPDEGRTHERNAERLVQLIDAVLASEVVSLDARNVRISGNIDADQIRILRQRYGFSLNVPPSLKGGSHLKKVKDERNGLAHGLKSFTECGRDVTYDSLTEIRRQVIPYLRRVLKGIDQFVLGRGYAS